MIYDLAKITQLLCIFRYVDWIFNKYKYSEHKDDIRCLLIKSLIETLKMDSETSKMKEFSVVNKNL